MYILVRQNEIIGMQELEVLDTDVTMITATSIQETNINKYGYNFYKVQDANLVLNPDYQSEREEKEKQEIAQCHMTPLDFINALETLGIEYSTIKALCDNNLEVDKQLRFCNHVYRGNPLLDQLCGQFGITSEQLDELFKKYGE